MDWVRVSLLGARVIAVCAGPLRRHARVPGGDPARSVVGGGPDHRWVRARSTGWGSRCARGASRPAIRSASCSQDSSAASANCWAAAEVPIENSMIACTSAARNVTSFDGASSPVPTTANCAAARAESPHWNDRWAAVTARRGRDGWSGGVRSSESPAGSAGWSRAPLRWTMSASSWSRWASCSSGSSAARAAWSAASTGSSARSSPTRQPGRRWRRGSSSCPSRPVPRSPHTPRRHRPAAAR